MNKEFAQEYIDWYLSKDEFPSAVNEVINLRLYDKAVKLIAESEKDCGSFKRIIEKYKLKSSNSRKKTQKNKKNSKKRISKYL